MFADFALERSAEKGTLDYAASPHFFFFSFCVLLFLFASNVRSRFSFFTRPSRSCPRRFSSSQDVCTVRRVCMFSNLGLFAADLRQRAPRQDLVVSFRAPPFAGKAPDSSSFPPLTIFARIIRGLDAPPRWLPLPSCFLRSRVGTGPRVARTAQ